MIDKEVLAYLRIVHGAFNSCVFLLFLWQGWLGVGIRRQRLSGGPLPVGLVSWHRRIGPKLALLALLGFLSGGTVALLDEGELFEHALHFTTGLIIAVAVVATFLISKQVKGLTSSWRTRHFVAGVAVVCLYVIQLLLGLGILF